ncbi:MAG TPA: YjdF family protein [Clostridia bacterium]|nr:YjdF family protein [Clostridia bacterium]
MDTVSSKLTVMFEEPFWIGLYEREYGGRYEVCKITFGPEPKDYEVYAFLLDNRQRLVFSPPIAAEKTKEKRINPKRMQRQISRQLASYEGIGTKAQQALKLQHEEGKQARKKRTKEEKDAEAERRFEQRQQKRKDKHNGH